MALWDRISSRGKVEDRRGIAPVVGGIGLTGIAVLLLFNVLAGGDPLEILSQLQNIPIENQNVDNPAFEGNDNYEDFVSTVLGSTNVMWEEAFRQMGRVYEEPKLVLFRTSTESSCGVSSSQLGPHYCPLDSTIYLDETFFDELTGRLGAKGGDVAEAYVIAHEVGHHAQNELGIMEKARGGNYNEADNEISIKLELQADCFAGLWANSIKDAGVFLPGEIEEAIDAAKAVGDDRIQEITTGTVIPENWTHGSSTERVFWFKEGFGKGNLDSCMTF